MNMKDELIFRRVEISKSFKVNTEVFYFALLYGEELNCMKIDNLVLGAGISGLACANEYAKRGKEVAVFEAEGYIGGLCHSFMVGEFRFDSAVHLSFTENEEARYFFDKTPYQIHEPISYNYYNSLWMKHPLLNNMYPMSVEEKIDCIESFVERNKIYDIKNYGEWLRASYGDVITQKFYNIYTKKYWTMEPEQLSTSWVGSRLNAPDIRKVLNGAFTDNTGNDYYAKEMRYPQEGGYESFLAPLKDVKIYCNKRAVEIDLREKRVKFKDGSSCYYNHLVSSIPLPRLVKCITNIPKEIEVSSKKLLATKVSLVSVGFNNPDIARWLWFYIYDTDIMAARVNSPSKKSLENVPKGCSSLQFEVYHHPNEIVNKKAIIENTKYALKKMKIGKEQDVLFMDYRLLPYGNIVYTLGMEKERDLVKDYLESVGIKLIGRFGEWDYFWSDQSYLSGLHAGQE